MSIPSFKEIFLEKFEPEISRGEIASILDMGSGFSANFIPLLKKYPQLRYVGIEPSGPHAALAAEKLSSFPNAVVVHASGYEPAHALWGSFDLVISLSVLEHVKQIERLLANSVAAARPGGRIVHRWDLGHALYPSSLKERFQVWLGDNMPKVLPEHKFVNGLTPGKAAALLEAAGAFVEGETYHQMPNHKKLLTLLAESDDAASRMRELMEWEFSFSLVARSLPEKKRLQLFPTVALWARKQ